MGSTHKLTKSLIDGLAPTDKDVIHWDAELKGFGVKVTPKGRKVFLVMHRPKGHHGAAKKYTIGVFGEWTVQQARERAREILAESSKGTDVGAQERQEAQKRASHIVNDVIDEFLELHAAKNRTGNDTKRTLKREVASKIGKKSLHDVTKRDILSILAAIEQRGSPIMANRTLAAIRKLMNWCVGRGIIEVSPAQGIECPAKEQSRDRVLADNETSAVIAAAHQLGYPFGPMVELLFMTGQRRSEVAEMRWSELDLDNALWTLPADRAKNGKTHDVHLSKCAVTILRSIPRFVLPDGSTSDLVFTTTGMTPISGFSKAKIALDNKVLKAMRKQVADDGGDPANVSLLPWTLHDIRRTVATELSKLGVAIHITEAILNHKSGTISGVTAVYQRNQFIDERRDALNRWCDRLEELTRSSEKRVA